ncbi:hypothetical protein SCFA_910007 [anaerobic digester metagenome]|uniref:Uncharacterized protein n=1 Tax=anaerobic digester metagenome TaxID=1263854 RepID=A0A485MDT0_9ZZZZ
MKTEKPQNKDNYSLIREEFGHDFSCPASQASEEQREHPADGPGNRSFCG